MKTNQPKTNWVIDVSLFAGFLLAFFLDLTGLELHQWLGVFLGALAAYHLAVHWEWVLTVTERFLAKTSNRSRLYYLMDLTILAGFGLIGLTGLIISTWLNLGLTNYATWRDLHVTASIMTLVLIVFKLGFHWRWILSTARMHIFAPPAAAPEPTLSLVIPESVPAQPRTRPLTRRDFLHVMGIVGGAALLAMTNTLKTDDLAAAQASPTTLTEEEQIKLLVQQILDERAAQQAAQAAAQPAQTVQATAEPTTTPETAPVVQAQAQVPQTSAQTTSCVVRCNRNCSAPGHCRRYVDSNGNNRCDLSECV